MGKDEILVPVLTAINDLREEENKKRIEKLEQRNEVISA